MATKTKTRSSIASTIVMTNRFEQRILECFYCVVATHSKSQRSQAASQVVITPSFAATFTVPILSPAPIPSSSFTLHLSEPRMSQCRHCVCHRCCRFHRHCHSNQAILAQASVFVFVGAAKRWSGGVEHTVIEQAIKMVHWARMCDLGPLDIFACSTCLAHPIFG